MIKEAAPDLVEIIVDKIRPYEEGNYFLWALGKIDNIDKHRLLIPTFMPTGLENVVVEDENRNIFNFGTITVQPGGTLQMIQNAVPMKIKKYGKPIGNIFFAKGQVFENQPVIPTLLQIAQVTRDVIQTFETHFLPD